MLRENSMDRGKEGGSSRKGKCRAGIYFISEIKSRFLRKEKYEYYTKDFEYFSGIF